MFIWTSAIAGEVVIGHMARLVRLNGITTVDDLSFQLRRQLPDEGSGGWGYAYGFALRYLAMASGTDSTLYLRNHSWLPYFHLTRSPYQKIDGTGFPVHQLYHHHENYARGPTFWDGLRFCRECVAEDIAAWGFSYWRRLEQFPGIETCMHHGTGLSLMAPEYMHFVLPHDRPQKVDRPDYEIVASVMEHPVMARYSGIAAGLMQRAKPIPVQNAAQVLKTRCKEIGLTNGRSGWIKPLRTLMRRSSPAVWLRKHFSRLLFDSETFRPYYGPYSIRDPKWRPKLAEEYVLALAVLFPSAEEALSRFTETSLDRL